MGKLLIIKDADFSNVKVDKVTPIRGQVNITVVASPTRGGIVSGSGRYAEGDAIEISAVAKEDSTFIKWSDDVLTPTRIVIVGDSDAVYTALFAEAAMRTKYTVVGYPQAKWNGSTTYESCIIRVYEGDRITVVPTTTGSYRKASIVFMHNSPDSLSGGTTVNYANGTNDRIQPDTPSSYDVIEDCYFTYLTKPQGWLPTSLTINGVEYIEQNQE